jgi:ribonuclease E
MERGIRAPAWARPARAFAKDIMTKKMLIDATHAEETRVVVVDGNKVEEFDFESLNKRQLAGNIYLAKVTRVEPSLQAAFVDYGGNRHGFLAFSEIHPDYYQIPKADREALLAEEAAFAREAEEEATREKAKPARGRARTRKRAQPAAEGAAAAEDAVVVSEPVTEINPPAEVAAESLEDVPPPSAAGGDIEILVPDEPAGSAGADEASTEDAAEAPAEVAEREEEAEAAQAAEEAEVVEGYEAVGGDDVQEERIAPRRPKLRRYKIQEVIKVRQILLVQVVKEERGNKGAALTTYLSLAGRYCVLMPNTARGGGISRKITNAADRKKLKEISNSITVPEGAGLIIRTAGANRTKTEIKRDYEYLLRQWEQIRDLTLKSIAPAPIYEEGSLIKRAIRDLYSRDIDEVLVDGERGYREAKDYMKMLTPSHAKNVKHYSEALPLFSRFQVESYLSAMFNPVVQLKSGGYIVIDVTEALVAIDVNSGRATREASIEETALKTNLEAAEEAARQMRLRDLAGLIVIDFIDMEDRRNNAAVEKRLKEKLKSDRARIQIGRISPFGLLEMSRQRLRPGMIEATTKACPHCHGTGRVRSDDSLALALLREIEEEGVRQRSKEVLVVVPVEIANYLLNQKREHVAVIEARFGLSVRVEGDASLVSPDYRIERFKTASRITPTPESLNLTPVAYPSEEEVEDEAEEEEAEETAAEAAAGDKAGGKRKRRRRRRGGKGAPDERATEAAEAGEPVEDEAPAAVAAEEPAGARSRSRRRSRSRVEGEAAPERARAEAPGPLPAASPFGEVIDIGEDQVSEIVDVPEADAPQRRSKERVRKSATAVLAEVASAAIESVTPAPAPAEAAAPAAAEPTEPREPAPIEADAPEPATLAEAEAAVPPAEPAAAAPLDGAPIEADAGGLASEPGDAEATSVDQPAEPPAEAGETSTDAAGEAQKADDAPKRRGWWSRALSGS